MDFPFNSFPDDRSMASAGQEPVCVAKEDLYGAATWQVVSSPIASVHYMSAFINTWGVP